MLKIYNAVEFINRIAYLDEVILFGAGKKIFDVEDFFSGTKLIEKVSMVIDNSTEKQGETIRLWNKNFEISALGQLLENKAQTKLVLITIEDYGALLDDLLDKDGLKEMELVCFSHITALQKEAKSIHKKLPECIRRTERPLIPKKLHYCWFGGKPIPDKYKRYMESWYRYCPDYDIFEWNESNYDVSKCKFMQEAYGKKMWGFVSDYVRMDVVYHNGGIYLDTDVQLIRNLDDLLYQEGFAGFEDEKYVNLGSGFGAVKGLPILKEMMEHYEEESFVAEDGELNLTPITLHNNVVLVKHGLINNGEYQRVADMTIYPAKVLTGKCMYTMRTVIKPWTYAVHHYDGSWATEKARRMNARMEQDMKLYHGDNE